MNEEKNEEVSKMMDSENVTLESEVNQQESSPGKITPSFGCSCEGNNEDEASKENFDDDTDVSASGTSISNNKMLPQSMEFNERSRITPSQEITEPDLLYALGTLDYDFGTEARQDSYRQVMGENKDPNNPNDLLEYLNGSEYAATGIIWTLNIDETPVYAIQPGCPFANIVYQYLRQFLKDQIAGNVVRVSIPGIIMGKTVLMSGQTVPMIIPELRGMFCWDKRSLVESLLGPAPKDSKDKEASKKYQQNFDDLDNFLSRIYYEMRNLGRTSRDRALNYTGTNAFITSTILQNAREKKLELQSITVEQSPLCRPGSDCWDVKLTFFNPSHLMEKAKITYRYTVDVSDVIPIIVGNIRKWSEF